MLKETITKPRFDIESFKQICQDNPTMFHKEIVKLTTIKKSAVCLWRKKLGFKRKKAQKTYKEADSIKKKNL